MLTERVFLVTSANGDLGEAVTGVLLDAFPCSTVHGVEAGGKWPSAMFLTSVFKVPRGNEKGYSTVLSDIAQHVGATMIIPCSDNELLGIASSTSQDDFDCPVLMPQKELVHLFTDKWKCAEWLASHKLPAPRTVLLKDAEPKDLPLVVKPRSGSGSVGLYRVSSCKLLHGLQAEFGEDYIAQKDIHAPEKEYTCALVGIRGSVRCLTLHRRLDAGRTVQAVVVREPDIERLLLDFIEVAPLDGPLNIQIQVDNEGPKIFEINPRLSSTVKMRHILGFKDLEWLIRSFDSSWELPDYDVPVGASVFRLSREICGSHTLDSQ